MFSYEEGQAFDAWYTKKPEPIQENIGREFVEKSVISDEPIYKGNKVLITEYGYMAFPDEVNALIGEQLDMYSKEELIDVLEAFSGEGFEVWIKGKIIKYINIFKKQGRNKEIMEILRFEEGRA
ncbi:hypothetical protein MMJ01_03740 [Enterococcus cecorum]|uniref:hypothetical protein n=1 Tax=Enterococcus cecorum TaxID=44008 RepID=UPI001FADEB41|nr:hypothetical protein [Enterococcus cecorum]MCJ0594274.1 hypothetical protein [Enterococcus cecorum]